MSEFTINENIAKIKVIGVGGAGGNAVNDMITSGITGVDFIAANTDSQDLAKSRAGTRIQLGEKLTKGLGAGARPEVGKRAVEEDKEKLGAMLTGTDMLFITAGMGGGTGTGAAPEIAKIAKELGILTIAIVTKPFNFEGITRKRNAELGIKELSDNVDSLVIIPNEKLNELPDSKRITFQDAFCEADNVLKIGIKGVSDLITIPGFINCDFADIRTIMTKSGIAMIGFGHAEGEDRAKKAAEKALSNPLLEKPITGARRVIYNITGGKDMTLQEVNEIANIINAAVASGRGSDLETDIIFGTAFDESMKSGLKVTIVATDFISEPKEPREEKRATQNSDDIERAAGTEKPQADKEDYDLLDIPAFIRRKKY